MTKDDDGAGSVELVPAKPLPQDTPYANATHSFVVTPTDVTILFLRLPIMTTEDAVKARATGRVEAVVISGITLPVAVARGLADKIIELTGGATQ